MNKLSLLIICTIFSSTITSCTNLTANKNDAKSSTQWDFDHNIQFKQTTLADNYFQLEVIPSKQVRFQQLATFLLRKSYDLCGGYHYKIEMIQGIEGFDDRRAMPNYIFPSLIAKIEC